MRPTLFVGVTLMFGLLAPTASADETAPPVGSMDELVRMDRCQLLALYVNAAPGPVPHGYTPGRAIFNPGGCLTVARSRLTHATTWQGKVFLDDCHMINKAFGIQAVNGDVFVGPSWYDGKPAIIIDYADSLRLVARYRDEFRAVAPGLYLGLTYERSCPQPELKVFFTLDAHCACR